MRIFFLIIIFNIAGILYQSNVHTKSSEDLNFNHRYLSNYFSALLSYDNRKNDEALKFFNSSKSLLNKHNEFLREYLFSLVENGEVAKGIKEIKYTKSKNSSNFFEAKLMILVDNMKKKKFSIAMQSLADLEKNQEGGGYEYIIYETLKSYNHLFLNNAIDDQTENFGKLSLITSSFQNCYLGSKNTDIYFSKLINSSDGDYSRYLFFNLANIIEKNDYVKAKDIASKIDPLNGGLLVSQAKEWIDKSKFKHLEKYFSCKSENDLLAEFFYLISNLYSSQNEFEKSNFYLNISYFLNPKFYFNLTLLAENYFINENYDLAKKIYDRFDEKNKVYHWYKTIKIGQIIAKTQNKENSLEFVENKFNQIKDPNIKILFDIANIYKGFKKFEKSIDYYSVVLSRLDVNSEAYASTLYSRGGSYERIKDYKNSDIDLLKSLEIKPEDPYVMNYLGYSWLERNYNIEEAIDMLNRAYQQRKNDPYIIDSVAWGYYLIGDYEKAENYIKQAVQLMPDDPIVNDHYGDILWKLDRKLQAKYFWENVLKLESTDEELKKKIIDKLIIGPEKT